MSVDLQFASSVDSKKARRPDRLAWTSSCDLGTGSISGVEWHARPEISGQHQEFCRLGIEW